MDKVDEKVKAEFKPLLNKCRELELSSEEKLPSLNHEINEKSINLYLGLLNELKEEYARFLEKISPIAGEIAGASEKGANVFKQLRSTKKLLEDLELGLKELNEVMDSHLKDVGKNNPEKQKIEIIKRDYIELINKKADTAQNFFSQKIYTLMDRLKEETERLESYYQPEEGR